MNPVAFLIFPYVLDTPKNANPTKSMQILHASDANPMQIPHTEHRKRGPNVGPRCLLRSPPSHFGTPYVHIFSSKKVLLPTCTCLTQAGTSLSNTFSKLREGERVGGGEDRDGGRAVGQARQRGLETLQGCPAGRGVGWPEGGFNTLGALGGWSILCQFASSTMHIHACIYMHAYTCMHASMHIHACMHACMQMMLSCRIYLHACIHDLHA